MNDSTTSKESSEVFAYYESPIGLLEIFGAENYIKSVFFKDSDIRKMDIAPPLLKDCVQQIDEYFTKQRTQFNLPLQPEGSPFQQSVWQTLQTIPYGKTACYLDIAKALKNPKAVRAVGAANGKNPISIIIPCHRIIGSKGNMVGYGGGLWRKKWLLQHEQNLLL